MGRIGPNISSLIKAELGEGEVMTVGIIVSFSGLSSPLRITFPLWLSFYKSDESLLKW